MNWTFLRNDIMIRQLSKYNPPDWSAGICKGSKYIIPLAQRPTPIQKWNLPLVPEGFEVYIKRDDLTGSTLSGNKVRKLEFLLGEALHNGCDTVITCGGVQSNFCRASAVAASQVGLKSYLFLRTQNGDPADIDYTGNLLLDRLNGTTIVPVPYLKYKGVTAGGTEPTYVEGLEDKMMQLADHLRTKGHKPYIMPVGGSNSTGLWGYIEAFKEMMEQDVHKEFDDIVVATGSGGTLEGLGIANYLTQSNLRIHGVTVCDDENYFYGHIDKSLRELGLTHTDKGQPLSSRDLVDIIDGYKGKGYALSTEDELSQLVDISTRTGVTLDPVYTLKGVRGMLGEMNTNPQRFKGKRILYIHTGGIFGLFDGRVSEFLKSQPENAVCTLESLLAIEK